MARINIEDSLFKDQRWFALIEKTGCRIKALGLLTSAWILAQQNWLKYNCIPKKSWPKYLDILIEIELAEYTETGDIYIKGSKKSFSWLKQKSSAGKKSAESRAKKIGKSSNANKPTMNSTDVQRASTESNGAEPHSLTHSLTHSQYVVVDNKKPIDQISLSMSPEAKILKDFFKENKLGNLINLVPLILNHFSNIESFDNWYKGVTTTKTFPKEKDFSEQSRYVTSAIKRELGLLKEVTKNV